jgi:hypothetical protein
MKTQEFANMRMGDSQQLELNPQSDDLIENKDTHGKQQVWNSRYESKRVVTRENLSSLLGCTSSADATHLMLDIQLHLGMLRSAISGGILINPCCAGTWPKEEDVTDKNNADLSAANAQGTN